ncbi:hypothetical protein ACFWIA_03560 [Streptomyces sp. NPDC127068]|uniref:hypothetical protein n=1 Tax=Streptomyces sp. NPDC127068 TaxID=3347127 RepID=UPI00365B729A
MSFGQGQGGPSWDSGNPNTPQQPDTPDWAALADASASRNRRKRLLLVGGAVLATLAVGAAVAAAVVNADGGETDDARPGSLPPSVSDPASESTGPGPSFEATTPPPPPDPKEFVSSADKDKAPISADTLFPDSRLTVGPLIYEKGATGSTDSCASVTRGDLGKVLTGNGCTRLMRATYTRDGIAVTVGVALFEDATKATRAKDQADKGNLLSLSGSGVSGFCNTTICRTTTNAYGRYAYFTVAGYTNGKNVTPQDRAVYRTGDDLAEFTFRQIIRRGEAQASAAAENPL